MAKKANVPVVRPIGKVLRALFEPCLPTPMMFIETALPAACMVLFSVAKPVWKQDIKLLTGKSWLKHMKGVVGDVDVANPTFMQGNLKFLFELAEIVDKAVWWMFIASMAKDFFFDWTSLAMQMGGCRHDPLHQVLTANNPIGNLSSQDVWFLGPQWTETSPTAGPKLSSQFTVTHGTTAQLIAAITYAGNGQPSVPFTMRIQRVYDGEVVVTQALSAEDAAAGGSNILVQQIFGHPLVDQDYQLQVLRHDAGPGAWLSPADGRFFLSQGGILGWL